MGVAVPCVREIRLDRERVAHGALRLLESAERPQRVAIRSERLGRSRLRGDLTFRFEKGLGKLAGAKQRAYETCRNPGGHRRRWFSRARATVRIDRITITPVFQEEIAELQLDVRIDARLRSLRVQ